MPQTHDSKQRLFTKGPLIVSLESLFWHWQRYPGRLKAPTPPLHEPARPRELEDPFRIGHAHAFRVPLTRRALVVGYWEPASDVVLEDEVSGKLLEAVQGAHIPGITATEIREWAATRDWSWLERLVRRFPALGAVLGRWMDSDGGFTAHNQLRAPAGAQEPESDAMATVIEWKGDHVIELEEARTSAAPAKSFPSAVDDPTFFPQTQEGRAALYPPGSPMERFHREGW